MNGDDRLEDGPVSCGPHLDSPLSLKLGHRGGPDDTPGSISHQGYFLNGRIDDVKLVVGRALLNMEIRAIVGPARPGGTASGSVEADDRSFTVAGAEELCEAFSVGVMGPLGVHVGSRGPGGGGGRLTLMDNELKELPPVPRDV
jgi:hypothetical protein